MKEILWTKVGKFGDENKQIKVFIKRNAGRLRREQDVDINYNNIGWVPILDASKEAKEFYKLAEGKQVIANYSTPPLISQRIEAVTGQNRYTAGREYVTEYEMYIRAVEELLKDNIDNISFISNADAFLLAKDKERTIKLFKDLNIPFPHTEVLDDVDHLYNMVNEYGDIFLKPIASSCGRGVTRIRKYDGKYQIISRFKLGDEAETTETTQTYSAEGEKGFIDLMKVAWQYIPFAQETIEPARLSQYEGSKRRKIDQNWDIRMLSMVPDYYDKIISAIVRSVPEGEIVANIATGGSPHSLDVLFEKDDKFEKDFQFGLDEFKKLKKYTIDSTKESGLGQNGIDFMIDEDNKIYCLELNGYPGYMSGYHDGFTLGDYLVTGVLTSKLGLEDIMPTLKETTCEDSLLEIIYQSK